MTPADFAANIIAWQKQFGRHDLPWQQTRDPYHIWLSEIMLQQTQVAAVVPYYQRFLSRFPTLQALAAADIDNVLTLWSGLGYYARARNLHRAARIIHQQYQGKFPATAQEIVSLPGIGRSTAAAIAAFAFGEKAAILDGNVKRVLTRYFAISDPIGTKPTEDKLWQIAETLLPKKDITAYTQGLMDLGATICTRTNPDCPSCPHRKKCQALTQGKTDHYPVRSKKNAKPTRSRWMPVLVNQGKIYLEKRPDKGIWGGLWSLPEVGTQAEITSWLSENNFATQTNFHPLPPIKHSFTHYHLHIHPLHYQLVGQPRNTQKARWINPTELDNIGLPAPIRRLLKSLPKDSTKKSTP